MTTCFVPAIPHSQGQCGLDVVQHYPPKPKPTTYKHRSGSDAQEFVPRNVESPIACPTGPRGTILMA